MPAKRKPPIRFCANCSQRVKGKPARAALSAATVFCCRCGFQVDAQGRCRNEMCQFFGRKPACG